MQYCRQTAIWEEVIFMHTFLLKFIVFLVNEHKYMNIPRINDAGYDNEYGIVLSDLHLKVATFVCNSSFKHYSSIKNLLSIHHNDNPVRHVPSCESALNERYVKNKKLSPSLKECRLLFLLFFSRNSFRCFDV